MAIILADTFTGSAGTDLHTHNALWVYSSVGAQIVALDGADSSRQLADDGGTCSVQTSSADHYCEVVLGANWNANTDFRQTAVRVQEPGSGRSDFITWKYDGTTYRMISGSGGSSIDSANGSAPIATDVMRLEASGTTIVLKKNGTPVLTVTDPNGWTYTRAGFPAAYTAGGTQQDDVYRSIEIGTLGGGGSSTIIYTTRTD